MSATITKWEGPVLLSGSLRRGGSRLCGGRDNFFAGGLEEGCQFGIFDGGMELLLARTSDQGMVRQPVFCVEALHLLKAVGAINAAANVNCPGFRHDTLNGVLGPSLAANDYPFVAEPLKPPVRKQKNLPKPVFS